MSEQNRVGVIGIAIQPNITDGRRSLEEILFDLTHQGLRDAGIGIDAIDGIVVGANDQYDGRAISIMMASGSVGGVGRDILSTPSSGEHAFVMGALRVASGQFPTQLVMAWSPTEASSLSEVQRLGTDPYYNRRLPMDENASHALQAGALEHVVPGLGDTARAVLEKNRRHGAVAYPDAEQSGKKLAPANTPWPLQEGMIAPAVTGGVALVLASEEFVREHGIKDVAWIEGMGWSTEPSFLGDRDLTTLPGLDAAVKQAYGQAGVVNPQTAFDVAEVADQTPYQELMAYAGLGLCARDDWAERVGKGDFNADGALPTNLSGGALTYNPIFCTGLIRIAEVAGQVRGRAGRHQKAGVKRGVAHAASGFAMQYNTVAILGRGNEGAQS